jgi:hypothetical protein
MGVRRLVLPLTLTKEEVNRAAKAVINMEFQQILMHCIYKNGLPSVFSKIQTDEQRWLFHASRPSAWPESIFRGADPRRACNGEPPRCCDVLGQRVIDAYTGTDQNVIRLWPVQYFQPTCEDEQVNTSIKITWTISISDNFRITTINCRGIPGV